MTNDHEPRGLSPAAAPEPVPAPAPGPALGPAARRVAIGWRFAALLATFVAGSVLVRFLWRLAGLPRRAAGVTGEPIPFLVTSAVLVLLALASTWVPLRSLERRGLRTVGLGLSAAVPRHLLLGLVGGGLTPALVVAGFLAAGAATFAPAAPDLIGTTLPMIGAMAFVSSWEEIALRGYFMQLLGEAGGTWLAVGVSGGLFGLAHVGNPGANPMGIVITALNGILLALLVVRTGSLWLACGYHAGWNLTAAVGLGLTDSGVTSPGALASTVLHGSAFWTGGSYGFEASIVSFVVEALVLLALLKAAPRWTFDSVAQPYFAGRKPGGEAGARPESEAGASRQPA